MSFRDIEYLQLNCRRYNVGNIFEPACPEVYSENLVPNITITINTTTNRSCCNFDIEVMQTWGVGGKGSGEYGETSDNASQ